ncbi:MAG: hypothetical protein ACOC1P_06855 [Minisyncoccales bacterium]
MKKKTVGLIWFFVYFVIGAYFLNSGILYYDMPENIVAIDKFIRIIGGALIIFGGINHLRASKKKKIKHSE